MLGLLIFLGIVVGASLLGGLMLATIERLEPEPGDTWWGLFWVALPGGGLDLLCCMAGGLPCFNHRLEKYRDRNNPRYDEIREHLRGLKMLAGIDGEQAQLEREQLEEGLEELRAFPRRCADIDGDALMRILRPELDALAKIRASRSAALEQVRRAKHTELD